VFSNAELDREGRAITLELALAGDRRLIVIGIYAPNNSGSAERAAYKWQWSSALQARIAAYQREQHGEAATIVVAGDFNVVPTALDHADPGRWEKEHGTLFGASIWRSWHGGLLRGVVAGHNSGADSAPLAPRADGSAQGLLDSFRIVHPGRKSAFTCWNSRVRARETNFGTRIDHILVSDSVCTRHAVKGVDGGAGAGAEAGGVAACACDGPRILDADVHQSIQGSDHCPVDVVLGGLRPQVATPGAPHPLSVAAHPSYSGAQRLVTSFFVKKVAPAAGAGAGAASAGAGAEARASASPSVTSAASKGAAASSGKSTGKRAAPGSIAAWVGTGAAKKSLRDGSGGDGGGGEDEVVVIDSSEEDKGWSAWDGEGASRAEAAKATWAALLQPPPPPPLCNCGLPMTQQVVRKEGPNKGRTFFTCSKPEGAKGDPKSHCGAFTWSKLGAC
jgi:AP endonuclease-2